MAPIGSRGLLQRIRSRARKITEPSGEPAAPAGSGLLSLLLVSGHDEDALLRTTAALLAENEQDLEIIVAAPAAPPLALAAMAAADQRLRVLAGTGLEGAFRASAGAFLTFIEPGAVPLPGLHRRLAGALAGSTADFVAAVPYQAASHASRSLARLREGQREGHTVFTRPDALADTAMWTKLYRRGFMELLIGQASRQDTESLVLRGYLLAGGFDYIVAPTGRPPAGKAVTVHEELLHLGERARKVTDLVCGESREKALAAWYGEALGSEWLRFSKEVPRQDESYWELAVEVAAHVLRIPGALNEFPVHSRILAFLAAGRFLKDFRTVLAELQDNGNGYRLRTNSGGKLEEVPAYLSLISRSLPAGLLRLRGEPAVRSSLRRYAWSGGTLQLGGFAYLEGLDADREYVKLGVWLVESGTGSRLRLPAVRHRNPAVDEAAGDQLNSYAGAGFTAELDAAAVLAAMDGQGTGTGEWYLELELSYRDIIVRDRLASRDTDRVPARFPLGPVMGKRRLTALFDGVLGLRFSAVNYRYLADPPVVNGLAVSLAFRGEAPTDVVLEVPGAACVPFEAVPSDPAAFTIVVPSALAQRAAGAELTCQIRAGKSGTLQPVGTAGAAEMEHLSSPGARILPTASGFGFLALTLGPTRIAVTRWRTEGTAVVVVLEAGAAVLQRPADLALTGPETITANALRVGANGQTEAVFELSRDRWGTGASLPALGRYRLVLQAPGRQDAAVVSGALAGERAAANMPRLRLVSPARSRGQEFQLQLLSSLKSAERGSYNRRRLIEAYWENTDPLDEDAVLFETFGGNTPSDSGLAISQALAEQRPGLKRFWSVAHASIPVPQGSVPLQRFSTEWFHVLGTAKHLVNNNDFPVFFRKRQGQVYVQTWHGTPLKRIGLDTPRQRLTPSYLRTLEREPGEWDVLLAQSPFAARQLAAAFRYKGRVAVTGYPRNDALSSPSAPSVRTAVRDRLRIPPQNTVVLYAPTWRDTAVDSNGREQAVSYLVGAEALAELGPGYSLLYRGHHKVSGRRGNAANGMTDVTDYPHVSDLCLAADLLVTDYSSIMFDFAVTGKPMFFLTPDLAQYRDRTRGFYFDFEEQAPGPITKNQTELFEQIRDSQPGQWAGKYRTFAEIYAPLDDGGAALRVCRAVWGDE